MAITLDELLGRNTGSAEAPSVDTFPSYGEYTSRRASDGMPALSERPAYNYDFSSRPYSEPRSVESARAYEASRTYAAPRAEEYRNIDYPTAFDRRPAAPVSDRAYAPEADRAPYPGQIRRDAEQPARGGLYEFTVNDAERASSEELYDRLSASSSAQTAQRERLARESYAENYAEKYRAENKARKKIHLGLKAKLLIAAYVAVVAVVSVLIIVNAKPLNDGTASVPSSSSVTAVDEAHNSDFSQIDFGYESPEIA